MLIFFLNFFSIVVIILGMDSIDIVKVINIKIGIMCRVIKENRLFK